MSNYKIGDFERRGNAMRLFLVNKDCDDYWGDDWNDRPYEHNAGIIYDEYVAGFVDIAVDLDSMLIEAAGDLSYMGNSEFCKEDFKANKAPFALIVPRDEYGFLPDFRKALLQNEYVWKFSYNDDYDTILSCPFVHVVKDSFGQV